MIRAAWWFRHQTRNLIRRLSADPRWETILAVSPDAEGLTSRIWPDHLLRWPQGRGDLGDRMGAIFRGAAPGPVIIIGADIPGIQRGDIAAAFKALGNHDAVLGPAPDGGYWLIGMKRGASSVPKTLFQDVRWSTETAMADTIESMGAKKIAQVKALRDVDTVKDL